MPLLQPSRTFDATRFTSSWLLRPSILFSLRALFSVYAFATRFTVIAFDRADSPSTARHDISYFTTLTFWGLAFYMGFAALHTGSYAFTRRSHTPSPFLARWPAVLQHLHALLYSTITVFPFLVTIVYWTILFSGRFSSVEAGWSNVSQHALNSVFALFEVIVPRTNPLPWLHVLALILLLACYLGVAYITYANSNFFVYDFLDFHKHSAGRVAAFIVGILAAAVVLFVVVRYVIWLRQWVTERKMGRVGKLRTTAGAVELGEYTETKEGQGYV